MAEYEVLSCEKVRTKPTDYGPKKVLQMTLRNPEGTEKEVEWFTSEQTKEPEVGEKIEGEVTSGAYGLNFKKPKPAGGGGGFKRSPTETKAIQRQHSQEMALRKEANLVASGGRPYSGEQMRSVVNWFEQDIATKDRATTWDGLTSDVPADLSGTPLEGS